MLITQVHIEPGCASESQQLQRPKDISKFPEVMTLLLHTRQARVALQSNPCQLLAPTLALRRKLAPHIPSTSLPPLFSQIPAHTTEVEGSGCHTSNQRPPGHKVFCWHNMKIAVTAWGVFKIILPYIPIIVISQILHVTIVHKVKKPFIETVHRHTKHKPSLLINRWQTQYKIK